MGTDYIDLYQTHWQAVEPEKTPIAETMECLLRAIGISNVSLDELKEYAAYGEIASNQPRYSMLCRDIEKEILPWCIEHQIATLAYSPLEQGLLTGKMGLNRQFKPVEWRGNFDWNPWFKPENRARVLAVLKEWAELTNAYECTLAQLVIAWTLAQSGVTHALCGARRVKQVEENVVGGQLSLTTEDIARFRKDIEALGQPS